MAELAFVVSYIPRWFTCWQTVTHPISNHLTVTRLGVEPTTSWSQVQHLTVYTIKQTSRQTSSRERESIYLPKTQIQCCRTILDNVGGLPKKQSLINAGRWSSKYEACIKHSLHEANMKQTSSKHRADVELIQLTYSQLVEPAWSCKRGIITTSCHSWLFMIVHLDACACMRVINRVWV